MNPSLNAKQCFAWILTSSYSLFFFTMPYLGGKLEQIAVLVGVVLFLTYSGTRQKILPSLLFIAVLTIQFISWKAIQLTTPDWAEASPKLHRLGAWFLLVPIACLYLADTRQVYASWSIALVGLLLSPWATGGGWDEIYRALTGERVDFGIVNAQHTSMLFGLALLGILNFQKQIMGTGKDRAKRLGVWLALVVACFCGFLASNTRSIYLGLIVSAALFLVTLIYQWMQRSNSSKPLSRKAGTLITTAVVVLSISSMAYQHITERWEEEKNIIADVATGNIDDLEISSTSIRIYSWLEAAEWIERRPLIGWGGKGRKLVIAHAKTLPDWVKAITRHLHSSYIDTLVNYGIAGLIVLLSLFAWAWGVALSAWRNNAITGTLFRFQTMFLGFWLTVNCFESYMYYSTGIFAYAIIQGGILALCFRNRTPRNSAPNPI